MGDVIQFRRPTPPPRGLGESSCSRCGEGFSRGDVYFVPDDAPGREPAKVCETCMIGPRGSAS